ncbi:KH_1 domain-containing protein [Cephalotus follicularis]|uniref:KH_1 domain-containing protein n=1 Tax=Cephalotus follicularis TaxID=3775 RepID=A0A1Q3ARX8_CEPFO|nr:KH_1 domain-containing protein [Cephalotus follicularis]
MTEEEIVAPASAAAASPASPNHKRKFDDLEPQAPKPVEPIRDAVDGEEENDNVAAPDSSEAKRPRIVDEPDVLANENGLPAEKSAELPKQEEEEEDPEEEATDGNLQTEDTEPPSEEIQVRTEDLSDNHDTGIAQKASVEDPEDNAKQVSAENPEGDIRQVSLEKSEADGAQELSKEETQPPEDLPHGSNGILSRKFEVPNNKVGVLIGKAGDTIRYLQYNSGAKIQITRDSDADPDATTRPVEIIGELSSIDKAEKLIKAVIAEADAGGSPSLVARGLATAQAAEASEQIEIQVPNEKVGLIIGKGGETIKGLQTKTGARIQLIPQHLPEGDGSKERTVRISGDKKEIEMARVMIKDVMNQTVRPSSFSSGQSQQNYRARGPTGPPQWTPRGTYPAQPMPYDYHQRGPYSSQNPQYQPPNYGGYPPQQVAPRSNLSSGWDYRPPYSMQGGPPQTGGYDYYGGQVGHVSDHPVSGTAPISGHASGPSPVSAMGQPPSQANYNYGQPQGPDYGHAAPYSQSAPPQQGYGHTYDEQKYDNHASTQYPYGGHGGSQTVYQQAGAQPGYAPQQQYGKPPSYGVPPQGLPPQSYGFRASQPGDAPYQAPISSAQSYGANVPPQQYPYASTGAIQQAYPPYGSASAADGYNQQPPASGPSYTQPGGQPASNYGQPVGHQAPGYGQVGPTGGYGAYPAAQQGYPEQPAANTAGYGYQAPQDPSYSSAPGSAYGVPPTGQPNYGQPAPTQPNYDQSAPQSGGYGTASVTAPVNYGKTVSPQPAYPQYDSTQMYAAPR